MTQNPSNMAVPFEAEYVSFGKLKSNVYRVVLDVQPDDMPTEFLRAAPGSKWMLGACRLNDEGEPSQAEQPEDGVKKPGMADKPRSNQAAIMCEWAGFQNFLAEKCKRPCVGADAAADILRRHFDIKSRTELKEPMYKDGWEALVNAFYQWETDQRYEVNLSR